MRRKMIRSMSGYIPENLELKLKHYLVKILLDCNTVKVFYENNYFKDDELAQFLGFETDKIYTKEEIIAHLKTIQTKDCKIEPLEKNLLKLQKLLNFSSDEKKLLEFLVLANQYDILQSGIALLGRNLNLLQAKYYFSIILDISPKLIDKKSLLIKSGILSLKDYTISLDSIVEIDDKIAQNLLIETDDIVDILKNIISNPSKPVLKIEDYSYLKEVDIILNHLKTTKKTNILLYGKPGTGKTELVKVLAKELQKELFEITYIDEDGDPIKENKRINAYKISQHLLKNKDAILLYDEAEDIFDNRNQSKKQNYKAYMNKLLETTLLPTIWITNDIFRIDDAIVRRFDIILEVPIPKKAQRIKILKKYTDNILTKKEIKKISNIEVLAPAIIERAVKVSKTTPKPNKTFIKLIKNTLKAQGYTLSQKNGKTKEKIILPNSYDLSILNCGTDLEELANGIEKSKSARICLYGPAGTGKSAFGKYIAKKLNKKLIIKKGSDLLSMFVGGTEENIAQAFREAKNQKAVLVFDEVDSFLADRTTAKVNWEITQVNEMLTQMEEFEGIFIATTNLIDNLDKASLRRFDLKLKFDYLIPKQADVLFKKYLKELNLSSNQILNISYLTPGDFMAVYRSSRFRPIKSDKDFIDRLYNEVELKNIDNNSQTVGFLE
jgi:SpoVK/Ycf46/Vps4 family AAA+-type ATPase